MGVRVYRADGKKSRACEFAQNWPILIVLGVAREQRFPGEAGKQIHGA